MTQREETDSHEPPRVEDGHLVLELTAAECGSLMTGLNFVLQDTHSHPDRWPWVVAAELQAIRERLTR